MKFVFEGKQIELTQAKVISAVNGRDPGPIQSLAVFIDDRWWPVKEPFAYAIARQPRDVNSRTALRQLAKLGFPSHDIGAQGPLPVIPGTSTDDAESDARGLALELAVELLAGQTVKAAEALAVADAFAAWLSA